MARVGRADDGVVMKCLFSLKKTVVVEAPASAMNGRWVALASRCNVEGSDRHVAPPVWLRNHRRFEIGAAYLHLVRPTVAMCDASHYPHTLTHQKCARRWGRRLIEKCARRWGRRLIEKCARSAYL